MHIYQSHMGGFYTTETLYNADQLYCETCGDSDSYLGEANNIDEAWELLKPETAVVPFPCHTCDLWGDESEGVDKACEVCERMEEYYECSGMFSLGYIMKFLDENFADIKKTYVYLLEMDEAGTSCLVKHNSIRSSDSKHEIPHVFCISDEYKDALAYDLMACFGNFEMFDCGQTRFLADISEGDTRYLIYKRETTGKNTGTAEWYGDGWYGFCDVNDISVQSNELPVLNELKKLCASS